MQVIADIDENETPIVKFSCPDCRSAITRTYAISHGARVQCPECGETILFMFRAERVEP